MPVPSLAPNRKTTPMGWFFWCERWDLNPHDLTDTSTSSLPVCRFQHARKRNTRYYNKMPLFVKGDAEKGYPKFCVGFFFSTLISTERLLPTFLWDLQTFPHKTLEDARVAVKVFVGR